MPTRIRKKNEKINLFYIKAQDNWRGQCKEIEENDNITPDENEQPHLKLPTKNHFKKWKYSCAQNYS